MESPQCAEVCVLARLVMFDWAGKLPAQQNDERDLVTELQYSRETSRLSCQIKLDAELDGLRLTLAPEE